MSKPKKTKEIKSCSVHIRVTPSEIGQLRSLAKKNKTTMSGFILKTALAGEEVKR